MSTCLDPGLPYTLQQRTRTGSSLSTGSVRMEAAEGLGYTCSSSRSDSCWRTRRLLEPTPPCASSRTWSCAQSQRLGLWSLVVGSTGGECEDLESEPARSPFSSLVEESPKEKVHVFCSSPGSPHNFSHRNRSGFRSWALASCSRRPVEL